MLRVMFWWAWLRLKLGTQRMRRAALAALALKPSPRAIHVLLLALDSRLYKSAEEALVRVGRTASPHLIRAFSQSTDRGSVARTRAYRERIAHVLARLREPAAVEPLIRWLTSGEKGAGAVATSLGILGDGRAVGPLSSALADPRLRLETVQGLRYFKDPSTMDSLIRAVENIDPADGSRGTYYSALAHALVRFKDVRAIRPLVYAALEIVDPAFVSNHVAPLGPLGVDPLLEILRDPRAHRRVLEAVKSLERLNWRPGNSDDAFWYGVAKGQSQT